METFSLKQFGASLGYKHVQKLGDRLEPISNLINWNKFRKFFEKNEKIGRPPYDGVMMIKMLVLQGWYGISDQELEYQVADRLSFQKFLGLPQAIPDYSTVWRFREDLSREGILDKIWDELERQMAAKGIQFSKGVIQDATFIAANPGKTNSGMDDRGRGQPTTRNEDGNWAKKGTKCYFGYKEHIKVDSENGIIKEVAVTPANVADCNIDLIGPDEIGYRDRGYYGVKSRARGNGTMQRASRGNPLTVREKMRNKRIAKIRAPGERPFAVMKSVMNGGHTLLTELHRVFVQRVMSCFVYNLMQMKRILA